MKLRMFRRAAARKGNAAGDGAAPETPNFARRALLTGGAVMAGAVGAGVAAAATAGPASADTGSPVLLGENNKVTTDAATEIDAANDDASPTLILSNTGNPGANQASPQLRLTPPDTSRYEPPGSTVGGDVVASGDGNLWFTHGTADGVIPAAVHTDFTANSFAPLAAPYRVIDTRNSAGRSHVLDGSGKFDSTGRLLAGKTIHINLTSLVNYGDAITANLTVINPASNGWVLVWSGAGSRPAASSIAFSKGQAIANLTMSTIAAYSSSVTDSIAITASATTHVLLDVAGFNVASLGQVNPTYSGISGAAVSRASRARAAHAAAMRR